jgi:hypothetical protein
MSGDPRLPIEDILHAPPASGGGRVIGRSRGGREIAGLELGSGPLAVSLIAGCHADEPVGPRTLRWLAAYLEGLSSDSLLLRAFTWRIVPHVNPDGEDRNRRWAERSVPLADHEGAPDSGYDLDRFLENVVRELPGDDVEFGFPAAETDRGARPENLAVADFLTPGGPYAVHGSLHGMALAPGPWFLLEEAWIARTAGLREALRRRVEEMGYVLFDPDRQGEKGFRRIDRGFTTRPDSKAMQGHFEQLGEPEVAARFRPSSMEFVRRLGGDPLTFVSEIPLFLVPLSATSGHEAMAELQARRLELEAELRRHGSVGESVLARVVLAMPVRDQMRLQLSLLDEALRAVLAADSKAQRRSS